eukprot:s1137_g7.t1
MALRQCCLVAETGSKGVLAERVFAVTCRRQVLPHVMRMKDAGMELDRPTLLTGANAGGCSVRCSQGGAGTRPAGSLATHDYNDKVPRIGRSGESLPTSQRQSPRAGCNAGASTLLAVIPHLHATPLGLELLPEEVRALWVCCTDAAVTQKDLLCRDRAQSIAAGEQMDFVATRCPRKGALVPCACGALLAPRAVLEVAELQGAALGSALPRALARVPPWAAVPPPLALALVGPARALRLGALLLVAAVLPLALLALLLPLAAFLEPAFSCKARRLGSTASTGKPGSPKQRSRAPPQQSRALVLSRA